MIECIAQVRENFNGRLTFRGCVITSYRGNDVNKQGEQYLKNCEAYRLMKTHISWTAKVDESTFATLPIMEHSPRCWAARDYKNLAREYLAMVGDLPDESRERQG